MNAMSHGGVKSLIHYPKKIPKTLNLICITILQLYNDFFCHLPYVFQTLEIVDKV
jgi:hypothetical protein